MKKAVQKSVKQVAKSGKRVTKHVAKKVITKSKAAVKGAKKAVKNTVEKVAKKGKYYADKKTIDHLGRIESKGEDFSLLNKKVMSSRASSEGGTSIVYRYSDDYGTKYMIHEVTDAKGYIIHRDFDAVRISSGQIINKGH